MPAYGESRTEGRPDQADRGERDRHDPGGGHRLRRGAHLPEAPDGQGAFKGEIKASSDLYVGEKAEVTAKIEADRVSAKGRIRGNIVARSRIELFSTAQVEGDLISPDLVMESGCRYNGTCRMEKRNGR